MANEKMLTHRNACRIKRNDPHYPGEALVYEYWDTTFVFSAPDSWADEQIWFALELVVKFYGQGHDAGRKHKAGEIRQVLLGWNLRMRN